MLAKLKNYWNIFVTHHPIASSKKFLSFVLLAAITAAIPFTAFIAQQQQTIRQRAAGYETTPPYPYPSATSPTTTLVPTISPSPLPPNSTFNPINWKTDHVFLQADDFYIIANGKKYLANTSNIKISSSAPYPPNFADTTLEAEWTENGVNMRMYIYFKQPDTDNPTRWAVSEIRTYDGSTSGNWIYYQGFTGTDIGTPLTKPSFDLTSKTNNGFLHFNNVNLQPFLVQVPKSGYYIYRFSSIVNVPIANDPRVTYGTKVYLFKDGNFLKNQVGFSYNWSIDNNMLAQITPYSYNSDCDAPKPCPNSRLDIKGLKAGSTIIKLDVKDSAKTVASTTINLTVGFSGATPTPTPTSSIVLLSPNGGEKLQVGKSYAIKWQASNLTKIIIGVINYTCSSELFQTVANYVSGSQGSYTWNIPNDILTKNSSRCANGKIGWKSGDNFKVFAAQLNGDGSYGVQDQSDNYFNIVAALTPTPAPSPTSFSPYLKLLGIGYNKGENNNPVNKTRNVTLELFTNSYSEPPLHTVSGTIFYHKRSGRNLGVFSGKIDLESNIKTGNYLIAIKISKYVKKQLGNFYLINGNPNAMSIKSPISLTPADLNNDNVVNGFDGNLLISCINKTTSQCLQQADTNDDGKVNSADFDLYSKYFNSTQ